MANKSIPLLKIIQSPSLGESSIHQGVFYEFENLEYFDIDYNSIQTIECDLKSYDGNLVYFTKGDILISHIFKSVKSFNRT